ncbi:sensor domain-containing diguanylate cyclase [Thalassotalea marina]|uniref:Diguanylate cyclase n=1 Tax=Thalassotalea marina TaxID=1673741 RepID=A0A919ELD0_9GAMM|nr:diguanylate cyclase [Thalassotalea marina]GHF99024.1 hypothetical protein GCM10017161_29230 [Thalassotalea marina]
MSDQKNLNAPLPQQVAMLSEILNTVGAFIYAKDLAGRYTYANQLVLDLFGQTQEQVIGKDDSHFFDLALNKGLTDNDQRVMQQGQVVEVEESNILKSTGELRIYQTVKKPLYDTNGNIIGMCGVSTDITERKRLENLVKEQNQLLDVVLNNVDAHIYMKDNHRTFKYVNSHVAKLFGLPAKEIIGKKETEILPDDVAEHFYQSDKKVFETGKRQRIEETVIDDDGNLHHYLSVKIPFKKEGQEPVLIGFSTEVTELFKLKEEFKKQANTDPLTGLYNRRYFVEHAEREFKRAQRNGQPLAVISLDIDHFKNINDKYGHPVGDQVLIEVSKNLLPNLRSEDVLARIGGEEFAIVLPETDLDKATVIAERIRRQQEEICLTGNWSGEIKVFVSVGVAVKESSDSDFDSLFSRSDQALYNAKNNGRNQVYCCSK